MSDERCTVPGNVPHECSRDHSVLSNITNEYTHPASAGRGGGAWASGPAFDRLARIVSLESLGAMCARLTTKNDRFDVSSVSRSRVRVSRQQPGWGLVDAIYPCYPSAVGDNPFVVLAAIRYVPSDEDDSRDGAATFLPLIDSPELLPGHNPLHVTTCGHELGNDSKTHACRRDPHAAAPIEWRTAEEWDALREGFGEADKPGAVRDDRPTTADDRKRAWTPGPFGATA